MQGTDGRVRLEAFPAALDASLAAARQRLAEKAEAATAATLVVMLFAAQADEVDAVLPGPASGAAGGLPGVWFECTGGSEGVPLGRVEE